MEEQPVPASPQSEERSEAGEEAPDGGAAAGGADAVPPPAGSPGTEEASGDMKKKSKGARSHHRGRWAGLWVTGRYAGQSAVVSGWLRPMGA